MVHGWGVHVGEVVSAWTGLIRSGTETWLVYMYFINARSCFIVKDRKDSKVA